MDEKETKRKTGAAALRENLRNERRNRASNETGNSASGTGQEPGGNIRNPDTTPGAAIQTPRRKIEHLAPTGGSPVTSDRRVRDNGRGAKGESERGGSGARRAEESHGGATPDTAATERGQEHTSHLEATETILEPVAPKLDLKPDAYFASSETHYKEDYKRTQRGGENVYALISNPDQFISGDEYKQLKTRKESETSTNSASINSDNSAKPKFFKGGVLSKQEAEDYYEPLVAAIGDGFGYADQGLWKLCPQLDERPIWSNTTTREDQALARLLLKRGQVSPAAALIVRETINSGDYVIVGLMFGPRAIETFQALRERPAVPAKKLTLFRKAQAAE